MQAQHDPGAERRAPGPDDDRPHLEQLRRRALDHRVARVPAVGRGPAHAPRLRGRQLDQAAAIGAQVTACPPGPVGGIEVGHRHRVGRVEAAQRLGAVPGGLPVHRAEDRDLGHRPLHAELRRHRRVQVVGAGRRHQGPVPGHRGQHPRLDLAQVGPDEHVPVGGDDGRAQRGRHVVQARRRRHPAGRAVRAGPRAAQPAVRAEVRVQPGIAVGGGDPLRLPPVEQRSDQRMRIPHLPQPRGPGVRHVDTHPGQQRLHLSRAAQVGGDARGRVPQDLRVTGGPLRRGVGLAARPGTDEGGQDLLRDSPVHRQPVRAQLHAEQFGGGLGAGRRQGHRPVIQRGQRRLLLPGEVQGQGGPACHPLRAVRPAAADPLRAQVPVRRHRVAGVAHVHTEQVERPVGRHRVGGQAAQPGPGPARVGPPAAEQQPVRRGDIPARGQPDPGLGQARRRLARPEHPARPQLLVRPADLGRDARDRPRAVPGGQPELQRGGDDQRDEIAAAHARLTQRRHKVRTGHGPNLATNTPPPPPQPRRPQSAPRPDHRGAQLPIIEIHSEKPHHHASRWCAVVLGLKILRDHETSERLGECRA